MKLAVIGSRNFTDFQLLKKEILKFNPEIIISGGEKSGD